MTLPVGGTVSYMNGGGLGLLLTLSLILIPASPSAAETVDILGCTFAYGESCEEISFYLWTRSGKSLNATEPVTSHNLSISTFDPTYPSKIVIHGYASGMNVAQLVAIRDEYLSHGNYNIITVENLRLTDKPCYPAAVHNTRYIGKCIARFIEEAAAAGSGWITQSRVRLHVIGFSLGGQTAGFVARHLKPKYIIDRITGLDPALPLFVTDDPAKKLTAADAELVDVVHTNAYVQGKAERCGHIDFYMNGAINQPGCSSWDIFRMFRCDHHRAPAYFAESIRSVKGFWGWRCSSIEDYDLGLCPAKGDGALMGEWWDPKNRGSFFITTNSETPFAKGLWWKDDMKAFRLGSTPPGTLQY